MRYYFSVRHSLFQQSLREEEIVGVYSYYLHAQLRLLYE